MKTQFRLVLYATLALALLLAACAPVATPAAEPTQAPPPAQPSAVPVQPTATQVAEPVTIKIAEQFNDAESSKFDEIIKKFEAANPGIKIEVERNNESNFYDKLVTTIMGGSAPDIARVEPPKAAQYIAAGYAANLDSYISADLRKQFFDGTLQPLMKDGSLYGVPQDVSTLALFYRTDMFQKAGISNPPATWDELVTDAQKLTDPANGIYGISLFGGWGAFEFYPWFWQAGGEMLKQDGSKITITFNSPEGVNALQFWVDLVNKYKVMPTGTANIGEDDVKGPFMAGKVAMFTSGSWSIASLKQNTDIEGKWSVAPLPAGKNSASVLGGMDMIILDQSLHKEEAAKFINFLMQDDIQLDWAKSLGYLPIKKSMYSDPFFQSDSLIQAFSKQLEVALSRPTIAQAGEVDDAFGKAVQAALSGAQTPQQALDEAAAKAQEAVNP